MNTEKRPLEKAARLEVAYISFHGFLRHSVRVAQERFARDGRQIEAQWQHAALPDEMLDDWVTSRLIERAPIMPRTPL